MRYWALFIVLILFSCKKEDGVSRIKVRFFSSENNENEKIFIDFSSFEIHYKDSKNQDAWKLLSSESGIVELTNYPTIGLTFSFALEQEVKMGRIDRLRLKIGKSNSIENTSGTSILTTPANDFIFVTIPCNFYMKEAKKYDLLLDLNCKKSVKFNSNGMYELNPLMNLTNVNEFL
jgi:hypothetical protein